MNMGECLKFIQMEKIMEKIIFIGGTILLIFPIFSALVTVKPEDKRREDEEQMEFITKRISKTKNCKK